MTLASTKRRIDSTFIVATFCSMVYQLCIFPNCNVFRIPQRDLSPIHPETFKLLVLLALHWLPVKFRICYKIAAISFKAIHNMGPAYLSNLINIKRCSYSNLQSNVGVILQDPIAKFKCTLRDRDHLLQLLQRYGTVYWTTLGKRMILDIFQRLIKTHYFKEA